MHGTPPRTINILCAKFVYYVGIKLACMICIAILSGWGCCATELWPPSRRTVGDEASRGRLGLPYNSGLRYYPSPRLPQILCTPRYQPVRITYAKLFGPVYIGC
jgi:hypothetical protein